MRYNIHANCCVLIFSKLDVHLKQAGSDPELQYGKKRKIDQFFSEYGNSKFLDSFQRFKQSYCLMKLSTDLHMELLLSYHVKIILEVMVACFSEFCKQFGD